METLQLDLRERSQLAFELSEIITLIQRKSPSRQTTRINNRCSTAESISSYHPTKCGLQKTFMFKMPLSRANPAPRSFFSCCGKAT